MCVCVCVCVFERERERGGKEGESYFSKAPGFELIKRPHVYLIFL